MINNSSKLAKSQGFTLVELMIAMVLGTILTTGIIQFFLANHQSARVAEALSRVQENGRFAMEFISRDIREADYNACAAGVVVNAVAGTNSAAGALNGSDTITLIKSDPNTACPAILTQTYSIQTGTGGIPYLFDTAGELVEGIENLQVLYGADTDADSSPNYYVAAGTAGLNMANVVSIRVSLVAVTLEDNVALQPLNNSFVFGTLLAPPATDRKVRRVFTSTIALRNRILL